MYETYSTVLEKLYIITLCLTIVLLLGSKFNYIRSLLSFSRLIPDKDLLGQTGMVFLLANSSLPLYKPVLSRVLETHGPIIIAGVFQYDYDLDRYVPQVGILYIDTSTPNPDRQIYVKETEINQRQTPLPRPYFVIKKRIKINLPLPKNLAKNFLYGKRVRLKLPF